MAGTFNLLRRFTLFMLLFSLWKVPLPPKSEIRSLYSPLMLAEKTNILYAGDAEADTGGGGSRGSGPPLL